jgi:nickel-dependent lactate racemase
MNDHPNARLDILDGNPVHEDMEAAAKKAGINFVINTVLTRRNEIVKVVAGDLVEAYRIGVDVARQTYRVPVHEKVDIVVSSTGGYPKDSILYIALKGFVPPIWMKNPVVREGGTLILVARCDEGLGSAHMAAYKLLMDHANPSELISTLYKPRFYVKDQWMAQVFARMMEKYELVLVSELEPRKVRDLHMTPAKSVEDALEMALEKHGNDARILVIPHGTKILPYLAS